MLTNIVLFLIQTIFDLYLYVVILRLMLQAVRADALNPWSQFAIRYTQVLVQPLQKFIPEVQRIDWAIVTLALMLVMVKVIILIGLQFYTFPNIGGLFIFAVGNLLEKFFTFYFYIILLRAVLSWFVPVHHNPLFFVLTQLAELLLRPLRKVIPLLGGFDLSPLVALIGLQVLTLLIASPLEHLGMLLM